MLIFIFITVHEKAVFRDILTIVVLELVTKQFDVRYAVDEFTIPKQKVKRSNCY